MDAPAKVKLVLNLHLCHGGSLNLNLTVLHESLNLIGKRRGKKLKRQGLSMCI